MVEIFFNGTINMTTSNFQHRPRRNWLQINITCEPDSSEFLIHELTTLTGSGVQTETVADKELIICYLEKDDDYPSRRQALDKLIAAFSAKTNLSVELSTLVEENWAENWKSNYKPARLSKHITVKPTWEEYAAGDNEVVIDIDPGMAFGTGLHFSTRLGLRHIDTLFHQPNPPATVLDIGTGTGILALACAKLGASALTAIDNDPDAVVTALDNIMQNNEQDKIACSVTDLKDIQETYDLVIANITADVLTLLKDDILPRIATSGHLVLSGILTGSQSQAIINAYEEGGLTLIDENQDDEWTGLLFSKTI